MLQLCMPRTVEACLHNELVLAEVLVLFLPDLPFHLLLYLREP